MCWSFQVSLLFSLAETTSLVYIYQRARRSKNPAIRHQLWVLPLLASITLVEVCETFIWLDPNLQSITEEITPGTCTPYNRRLTWYFWIVVFPLQPLLVILPCRRFKGGKNNNNWESLRIPEYLATTHAVFCYLSYIAHQLNLFRNPSDFLSPATDIRNKGYMLWTSSETCTYVGRFSHLFWTLDLSDSWFTPNAAGYFVLMQAVFYTNRQTWRFLVGCLCFCLVLLIGLVVYFQGTAETTSVWCWTGLIAHSYVLLQPHYLPCHDGKRGEEIGGWTGTTTKMEDEEDAVKGLLLMDASLSDVAQFRGGRGSSASHSGGKCT